MTGHLFQARFASFVMDDAHFLNALRYLAFNPVRAGVAAAPAAWPWSSVPVHLQGREEQAALEGFERRSPNGRPHESPDFIAMVERKLGRTVQPGKKGRKPRDVSQLK